MPPLKPSGQRSLAQALIPVLAAAAVIAIFAVTALTADSELGNRTAGAAYYNRLADGFAHGRLSLELAPPAGLAALANPYDPAQSAPFRGSAYMPGRVHDLTYYRGRFYLYFSSIPALVLFLPFHLLTGAYLSHQQACLLFCAAGFLASAALAESIRRRCFPGAGSAAGFLGILCLGLASLPPVILERPDLWEIPVTASYAFWMLCLLFTWISSSRPPRAWAFPLLMGLAAALAIGCRPNSCPGVLILLFPLWRALRSGNGRRGAAPAAAALLLPVGAVVGWLLAYNYARFGNPLEFGQTYQLAGEAVAEGAIRHFDPAYFGYNFALYFLDYPGWAGAFPFARELSIPRPPAGYGHVEHPVALLALPFVLCAAAVPMGLRSQTEPQRQRLKTVIAALLILAAAGIGPLCLYFAACVRYQLEFIPELVLLAVVGFFALASSARSRFRLPLLGLSGCAAAASIAFNLLFAARLRGDTDAQRGAIAERSGQPAAAAAFYQSALRLEPSNASIRMALVEDYLRVGRLDQACEELARTVALVPDSAALRSNHAYLLLRLGRLDQAAAECDAALRLDPGLAAALNLREAIERARASGPLLH